MTTTNVSGMSYPTSKSMIGPNPRDSAIAQQNASNIKLQQLQQISKGGRRSKKRWGGTTSTNGIVVPQFQLSYTVQNGPGQDPNSQITQNAGIGTQGAANAVYDNLATQKGGKYGSNITWGCYSGGKKYRKSNKYRKSKKYRKSRKNRR